MSHDMTHPRPIIPVLAPLYAKLSRLRYPLIRAATGLMLMPHGAQKLFGWFGGYGLEGTGGSVVNSRQSASVRRSPSR